MAAPAESDPQIEQLREAHTLFESGEWQRAIDEHIHPVIGHFERTFKDSDQALYAAEGMKQAILYSALPHDGKQGVTVLDSTWADAYQLKAYALGELGDVAGARAALKSALALSPMSATYTSELAYTYQSQHDHTQALALYRQAAEFAELASDEARHDADLGRAWRGQAFTLIEQGQLTEAKTLLNKCLELDPKDASARNELTYIEKLEQNGRP